MMNVNYKLCDPNGNITALVTDKAVKEDYASIASEIMTNEPTCEQVGFLSFDCADADIRLDMAGGEFCGNATLCTAAYKVSLDNSLNTVKVSVSGYDEILEVAVEEDNGIYTASTFMPTPKVVGEIKLEFEEKLYKVFKVEIGETVHLIIEDEMDEKLVENALKKWCVELKTNAIGLLFFDEEKSSLKPYVYCESPYSFFLEHACASGTTALAAYLVARENKLVEREILQPGGMLKIKAAPGGKVKLTGTVKFIK